MKIAIVGYSGSGKSTLARFLGEKYGLPVLHLDQLHWLPGWQERDPADEQRRMTAFLNENAGWVIDGNYANIVYARRLAEADRIIWLNFNRVNCLYRACRRYLAYHGCTRESMAFDCAEKLDLEFVRWILADGRSPIHRARYAAIAKKYPEKLVILKNQRELTRFMEK